MGLAMNRRSTAFFVAPLTSVLMSVPYLYHAPFPWSVVGFVLVLIVSYGGMIAVGIPAYLFLRSRHWLSLWVAVIVGFIAGGIMIFIFAALFALLLGEGGRGMIAGIADGSMVKDILWPGGPMGAVTGVVFWLIARPDRLQTRASE
jgi:hypothetical protein